MRFSHLFGLAAVLLVPAAHADLTIHYKTSYAFASGLPAQMTEVMKQQMAGSMPAESAIRIHGDQAASSFGRLSYVVDYAKQQITLLHAPSKRYATTPSGDFAKLVRAMIPEQALAMMEQLKMEVTAAKTGKTAMVHDVPAEEVLMTRTMDLPGPAGLRQDIFYEFLDPPVF